MNKLRIAIGWAAITLSALAFLPLPLPALPPLLTASTLMMVPLVGTILMMIHPALLFAAGIGLVKEWEGGKKLFAAWSALAIPAALVAIQYNYVYAVVDLVIIAGCLIVLFWDYWRRR